MAVGAESRYLTSSQAARLLHVSPKTIARWASLGLLPCAVTLGGHRRFRRDDIDELVRQLGEKE